MKHFKDILCEGIKVGDIVRIKPEFLNSGEAQDTEFVIVDVSGPRLLIKSLDKRNLSLSIPVTEPAQPKHIVVVKGTAASKKALK